MQISIFMEVFIMLIYAYGQYQSQIQDYLLNNLDYFHMLGFKNIAIKPATCWMKLHFNLSHGTKLSRHPLFNSLKYTFAVKTVNLPFLADSINQGTVAELLKKQGDWVNLDETVANVETDKVTVQIKSPHAGKIVKYYVNAGDNLDVGKQFFDVQTDAEKPAGSAKPTPEQKTQKKQQQIKTTQKEEPKKQQPAKQSKPEPKKEAPKPPQVSSQNIQRKETRQPLSRLRQRVAQRLKQSQNNYALLTTFQQCDMGQAQNMRKALGEDFQKRYGVKLGFMSFFLKAATLALQQYPVVNSVIDGNEIVRRNYVDISVAVATPTGLMVPVLRNCQNMKFHDYEMGLAQLAKKGKDGKITIEQMQGGTFTISNGGTFGSLMGTPILNPPQSAILGMHSIINRPVVRGDQIVARPMMYLALTYDHRLLDGKDAVLFLKRIQTHIEDPRRMLLQI